MNSTSTNRKILYLILSIAFILRFYKLGQIPYSLDWDENSNAYNAYSILKTGRDEYGTLFPLANQSFEDYKPPLYMYLNVTTVRIFGLTPFAARLPSALFGFLTVIAFYCLAKKLFGNSNQYFTLFNIKLEIPLVSTAFFAVSPWHIQFSRVGFEAGMGLFFAVGSITAFLYGISNKRYLILSAILLGISAYSYHTERIFVPLLFIVTFIIYRKQVLKTSKRYLLSFTLITIIIALPLAILIPPRVILRRFQVTTGGPRLEDIDKSIKFQYQDHLTRFSKIIHNRRLIVSQTLFANYLSHFDFNFLFTKGDDNFRHHIQGMGMFYLFELPLVIYGLFNLVRNRSETSYFILFWLLIAPIAATPAAPNPHGNRALPMVVPLILISSYSFVLIFNKKLFHKNIFISAFSLWIAISVLLYLHDYFVHYPVEKATFWQYGYAQAVEKSEKIKGQYERINIDSSVEQAYAFWLFNTKYDPALYQKSGSRFHFDKYYFSVKNPDPNKKELYISTIVPGGFEAIDKVYYPDGTEALKISRPLIK